jgi:hypothetical protein
VCSFAGQAGVVATIQPSRHPLPDTLQAKARVFHPHMVLLRAGCRGDCHTDWRYKLSTLAHANIPTVNAIDSFFYSQDKAQLYGKLRQVQKRLGVLSCILDLLFLPEICFVYFIGLIVFV